MTAQLPDRLRFALDAARQAGRITLEYFLRDNYRVERKSDESPVTVADRRAEEYLRRSIEARYPRDGILGEEFGEVSGASEFRWILDPIDGTKSFISGVPLYGTLIGVERAGHGQIGVIHIPALDETVFAAKGHGAWYTRAGGEPVPARVSDCDSMDQAVFVASQVDTFWKRGAGEAWTSLERVCDITRTWGDCYGYLLVATGRAHLMVDPILNVWDAAAVQPVLEEAGGHFTDWKGKATFLSGEGVGTTSALFPRVMEILRPYSERPYSERP